MQSKQSPDHPPSPRRGGQSPGTHDDASAAFPFPRSSARHPSMNHVATEIHWDPPNSIKRHDPATPPPGMTMDTAVSPFLKTRRLLPPSRRVDAGDDELDMESPPKVVRQSRISIPAPHPSRDFLANNTGGGYSGKVALEENEQRARKPSPGVPVTGGRLSECVEDADTYEYPHDSISTSGRQPLLNRLESSHSMTSRSMASHSTQAELDFYMQLKREDSSTIASQKTARPQGMPSSQETSKTHHAAVVQRRRVMLAKSAAMLRSHRPAWDQTESIRSFCSQTSSAAWSLGGSTLGGSTIGGVSRASSRKSFLSSNTGSQQSRTPTPPENVRMTSCGTTGKPRPMVANNPVATHAHRPVPALPSIELRTSTSSSRRSPATDKIQCAGTAHAAIKETSVSKPSLLEDDDTVGDLRLMANNLSVKGEPSSQTGDEQNYDSADDATVAAYGGLWQPQAGGSFMLYRRTE